MKHSKLNTIMSHHSSPEIISFNAFIMIFFFATLRKSAIRTSESKTQDALMSLSAQRRLCITGTPLQNNIFDLLSLLKFLCCNSTSPHENWPEIIIPHLQQGNIKPLQMVLRHVMLRRLKSSVLPDLPPIQHTVISTPLKACVQDYYDEQFELLLECCGPSTSTSKSPTQKIFFQFLHKIRGICDHPLLADPEINLTDETTHSDSELSSEC